MRRPQHDTPSGEKKTLRVCVCVVRAGVIGYAGGAGNSLWCMIRVGDDGIILKDEFSRGVRKRSNSNKAVEEMRT